MKTLEAVDQDKQGISGMGLGQLVTAKEDIYTRRQNHFQYQDKQQNRNGEGSDRMLTYPPMEMPVTPSGQYPSLSSQRRRTVDSRIRAPPITNRSDTFFRLERLKYSKTMAQFHEHELVPPH